MKFIDDVTIEVAAGRGGDGCLSFRREKFIPLGGPNGGDGGHGGDVYLVADASLNTLVDFRNRRLFKATVGRAGSGKERTGARGDDLEIAVPVGTIASEPETGDVLGEMLASGGRLLVARGGVRGLGNTRFKSSTNRSPRKITTGKDGERRKIRLELRLLADVGLLGLPNAGKSTLISAISAARPKVADYPFTTRYPNLGVVRVESYRSFVMADIPGIIEGAAEGAGLGLTFLKHLSRTRLLLHLVDVAPMGSKPVDDARIVVDEVRRYSDSLATQERWLVLNKLDLVGAHEREAVCDDIVSGLAWPGPVFQISAVSGEGCEALSHAVMTFLEAELDE